MFRCKVPLNALGQTAGFARRKGFIEGMRSMRVEIVLHQNNPFGVWMHFVTQITHHLGVIHSSAPIFNKDVPQ